jgi:hypothetical protein
VASPSESGRGLGRMKIRAKKGHYRGIYKVGDILEVLAIEDDQWGKWYLVVNSEGHLFRLNEKDCEIVEEGK